MSESLTIGVDLGQARDPTAIAVVRGVREGVEDPVYQVGHLERLPLGMPYPGVIAHVGRLMARLPRSAEVVLDFTGVGRPVYDLFVAKGFHPVGVSITSGDSISREGMIWRVPKLTLISTVQALLHNGQLKIHKGLADAQALVEELQDFRAEATDSGYWRFGARAGKHDDLVLALAIACWRAHAEGQGGGIIEFYRRRVDADAAPSGPSEHEAMIKMRAPDGISHAYFSGRCYPCFDGEIELPSGDAEIAKRNGYVAAERAAE